MADKPISFSGPMVRALLDDRKTQTRRLGEPRYAVGDRLYVREAWRVAKKYDGHSPVSSKKGNPTLAPRTMTVLFEAGGSIANGVDGWTPSGDLAPGECDWAGKYRQAMHMPRWASRLFLVVTEVRQQPLADISREDAIAEGVYAAAVYGGVCHSWLPMPSMRDRFYLRPEDAYFALLDHLHGDGFSAGNPLLSAYSFTVERGNIDGP